MQRAQLVGPLAPLSELEVRVQGPRVVRGNPFNPIPMWMQAEYAENPAFLAKATAQSRSVIQ